MERPNDITLPFFAYGIFRSGQIGFFQLKDLVSSIVDPSEIVGQLLLRDGLPIVDPNACGQVKGALLRFKSVEAAERAYDRISCMEPDRHYRWEETAASGSSANILVGRSTRKGSVECEEDQWDGWKDPLFTSALEVVEETISSQKQFEWHLKPLFRLQMAYLLLWSAIERYVSLRYNLGDKVVEKVKKLANEDAFANGVTKYVRQRREVYRADQPDQKEILDPQHPEKAFKYYYQIRSNIVHRGKAVVRDHERLLSSLTELLAIFRDVLTSARADAQPNT